MNPLALSAFLGLGALLAWSFARARAWPAGPELDLMVPGFGDELDDVPEGRVIIGPLQMASSPADMLPGAGAAPAPWTPPETAAPYLADIERAERANGLPRGLLARVLYQESRFRPEIIDGRKRSSAGAIGIAQFMPATAADLGVNPLDPASSIDGAARYLARLHARFGDWREALAAYNWGQGNVSRRGLDAAPAETRAYWAEILADVPV